MRTSLTDVLCTRCGLCCDGALLADVELSGRSEAGRAELLGLRLDDDSDRPLLLLPCAALDGTRCGVYAHRPRCCRTFECRLLRDARHGAVTVEQAARRIAATRRAAARVKEWLARLRRHDAALPLAEQCAEALAAGGGRGAAAARARAGLEAAMAVLERSLRDHFLGERMRGNHRA